MKASQCSIFTFLELPDYLTLLGGMLALSGALAAINQRFTLAAGFLLLSVPCDYFDGKLARARGRRSPEFGKALDTIVDTASFGVCPVIFGYALGLTAPLQVFLLLLFAASAMLRLARFTVLPPDPVYFVGMPVTYNNLFIPGAYLAFSGLRLEGLMLSGLSVLYGLSALLMASRIHWKKF